MQDLIKRYFWVLGAITVAACATFLAVATSFFAEAVALSDPDHGPKITPVSGGQTVIAKAGHSKEGAALAQRDMFCSECLPKVEEAPKPGDTSGGVVNTSLPLQLLATNVGATPKESFATIINTENQEQGSFEVGDKVPGASGGITEIHYKYVEFQNAGHIERVVLQGAIAPEPPKPVAVAEQAGSGSGDDLDTALIKKIDDNNYEIDKSLIQKVLENPMAVAKNARVVPAIKNGKPDGFKLYAIKKDSVFDKMGLTNGDTLESINSYELTSADKALEVYTKVRDATSLQVEITRRGKPVTINYTIK
jgi:general secretion pathway protein C